VIRDGKEKLFTIKVTEKPSEKGQESSVETGKDLGITVTSLTPRLARRYGLRTNQGVLITEIRRYSEAERKGLERWDIIIEANRKKVKNVNDLERVVNKLDSGDAVILLIRRERNGQSRDFFITLRIPE
jgi:serine protease Do